MSRWRVLLLTTSAILPIGLAPAYAGPNGASVVAGSATVQGQGTASVVVNQSSQSAIINWNTFNIGVGESTKINMPGASSVELDRVTGGLGPSQILGSLTSNGNVFLVNRDGILFGQGAKVNVGGLLATTNDIANSDFMAGRYNFSIPGNPSASVVNQGSITALTGGFAALVAPGVRNTGTIAARLGTIALASGNAFTLDFYGDSLITLGLDDSIAASVTDVSTGQPLSSLVSNAGTLKANGGTVQLTAVAARQVVDSVINNTGFVEANTIGTHNGMIVLEAATGSAKPAGAPTQTVKVSGRLSAAGKHKGTKGGTIEITGENIALSAANLDASGRNGGGTVLIGGDWGGGNPNKALVNNPSAYLQPYEVPTATTTSIDAASSVNASAINTGNGGKVIVWSESATTFYGTILAQGGAGSGNGGFVETSGKQLVYSGLVNTRTPRSSNGTVLLDPQDVTIGSTGGSFVTPQALEATLANSNAIVFTDATISGTGDIIVAQNVSWSSNSALILAAYRDIIFDAGVSISNIGTGSLDLGAGVTVPASGAWYGNGVGTVVFNGAANINFLNSTGFVNLGYNPVGGYTNPTNFTSAVTINGAIPNQFSAYMWVNNASDLQNINQNLSGTYALANNIDASATTSWNAGAGFTPIGTPSTPFIGSLVGFGGTVPFITQGATVNGLTINSGQVAALFNSIGSGGLVEHVGLTNVNLSATGDFAAAAAFAEFNSGVISNAFATGKVTASSPDSDLYPADAGGLVDFLRSGTILQSYSAVTVDSTNEAGGLAANMDQGSLISRSYATGSVHGFAFAPTGGLIGDMYGGTISEAYAIGSVAVTGGPDPAGLFVPGGLVGIIGDPFAINAITNSYWDAQTTGQLSSAAGSPSPPAALKNVIPVGFDPAAWNTNPSINNGYPYLIGNPPPMSVTPSDSLSTPSLPPAQNQINPTLTTSFNTTVAGSTPQVIQVVSADDPSASLTLPNQVGGPSIQMSALNVAESLGVNSSDKYYTPANALDDSSFMSIVKSLGLNTNFDVTSSDYSSNKVTSLSSGGDGTSGYIYPPGTVQDKEGWAECVSLVVALKGVSWDTALWKISGSSVADGGAKPGDPIATFNSGGAYSGAHAAIFVGYKTDATGKILGWYILDQNNVPGLEKPASIRYYSANSAAASSYYSFTD